MVLRRAISYAPQHSGNLRKDAWKSTLKVEVSDLDSIVEELKAVPPERLASAADYIHRLKTIETADRIAIIDRTSGALSREEGDELARIIEEGCEQVDGADW